MVDIQWQKVVPECARQTTSGDKVKYPGEVITHTADLTTVKLHLNSVVSTPNRKFLDIEISNFYLDTPSTAQMMPALQLSMFPITSSMNIILQHSSMMVFILYVVKGMYGLP